MKIQITITLEPGEAPPDISIAPPVAHHRDSQLDSYVESAVAPIAHSQPIGFRP